MMMIVGAVSRVLGRAPEATGEPHLIHILIHILIHPRNPARRQALQLPRNRGALPAELARVVDHQVLELADGLRRRGVTGSLAPAAQSFPALTLLKETWTCRLFLLIIIVDGVARAAQDPDDCARIRLHAQDPDVFRE